MENTTISFNGGPEIGFGEVMDRLNRLRQEDLLPEVKSATLVNSMHLNYSYDERVHDDVTDTISRKGRSPIHSDLRRAFWKLGPHLAVACEEVHLDESTDIDEYGGVPQFDDAGLQTYTDELDRQLMAFEVTSLLVQGTGDKAGVVLVGSKKLSTGDFVKLESPRICWASNYPFLHDLRLAHDTLIEEVQAYKLGKQAPAVVQGELFDGEGDSDLD